MGKLIYGLLAYILVLTYFFGVDVCASTDDYSCFVEIMMSSGKLLKDFTEEEVDAFIAENSGFDINDIQMFKTYIINSNVSASYISSTLYNFNNKGGSDLDYEVSITLETANKISYKFSDSLSVSTGKNDKVYKGEIANKCDFTYSNSTEESKKVTEKMKIKVEAGSRCVIYLIGELSITNGFLRIGLVNQEFTPFEVAIIQSQYPKIEKEKI